jgi:hypothetical protein
MILKQYYRNWGLFSSATTDPPARLDYSECVLPPAVEARVAEVAQRLAALARIKPPRNGDDLLGSVYLDPVPPSFRCPWVTSAIPNRWATAQPPNSVYPKLTGVAFVGHSRRGRDSHAHSRRSGGPISRFSRPS